ncbi:hypothetical protein C8A00DRAFT_30028 [Chaetomidium leptoderma]|uniref:Uncharacterized protein n=1 Tax=Chaetomidium leptoderma TaxID=669021 RepID=A0AAN6VSX4_9PEZI|nr:hypothetical protein C8A00DRAFT_30028 [Chaetomidium leptoderma]
MAFNVGDRVKNPSDNNTPQRVFIVKSVSGTTYKVQREGTNDAEISYQEHELVAA